MRPTPLLLLTLTLLSACAGGAAARGAPAAPGTPGERLGIEVQPPRLAAAGYLVDLRYRVLDADRAAPLAERGGAARLVVQGTNDVLGVAGGAARPAEKLEVGKVYSILFDNTGRKVAPGARVNVEVGGLEIRDLTVGE